MGLLSEMAAEMLERIKADPKTVGPLGRLVDREALARALTPPAPTTPAKAPKEDDPNEDTPAKLAADVRALLGSPAARLLATRAAEPSPEPDRKTALDTAVQTQEERRLQKKRMKTAKVGRKYGFVK
jgi:hypothetical protein